ncbi:hypothetical protein PZ897_05430 [Hoeflea sp. YIM 152468]|uniref:hypothetical protein n=1 Tax=Hoeflea sp. YIM 152468 TaxID=3031759 RepID=UPI0023DAD83C|nr:hypothetical protein [Hoeflea sp. YIM 152468]MDF1607612.1 hypothetical protein [Hoeflea sp. YIM 152468]
MNKSTNQVPAQKVRQEAAEADGAETPFHTGQEFPTTVFGYPGLDPTGWLHLFPPVEDTPEGDCPPDPEDPLINPLPDYETFNEDDLRFDDGHWIEIDDGEPGPMGPPPPPLKPKPLPPISKGPGTRRDRAINKKIIDRLKANSSHPVHRKLERRRIGRMYDPGTKEFGGMKFRVWRLKEKYRNCSKVIRWTFYAAGRPYWGEPAFFSNKKLIGAGGALDGMKAGRFVVVGELTLRRYQDVGAVLHITCGEKIISIDVGTVHTELIREVAYANYAASGWYFGVDSTKSGGNFNQTMLRWNKFSKTPRTVPKKYGAGVSTSYSFGG